MSIRVALHHTSRYSYDRPVTPSPHVVRLRPAPHCRTPIVAYSLRVQPETHFLNWQQDPFGNYEARIVFQQPASELVFEVDLVAELTVVNPFDFFLEKDAEHFPFAYSPALKRDLEPYLRSASYGPKFAEFVEGARSQDAVTGRRMVDVLVSLNQHVQRSLRYDIRMEPGVFLPEETLVRGHGSCRDFAWLLVQTLRHLGLAARFVSGYSIQLRADEKPLRGSAGVERDSTDLHAWAEVFLPGAGWVGLDATSGLMAGEGHIPLACTPDPENAAPITGAFGWAKRSEDDKVKETFAFSMSVQRVLETPRVTAPYTDEAWNEIVALGRTVDAALAAGDVRLTMGGEPTFVADADREGAEWNIDALGPTKRRYATDLLRRLYSRFAPHGLLHEGQGKWYPGEPLPRWALSCYFRKDGLPIWHNPDLLRGPRTRERHARGRGLVHRRAGPGARGRPGLRPRRLRRRVALPLARAAAARQRRSARVQAREPDRAGTPRARLRERPRHRRRLRASAATRMDRRERRRQEDVANRPLARAPGAPLPDSGRLADGLSVAARLASLGRSG